MVTLFGSTRSAARSSRWRATYAHTGTAVACIISELPGGRAEALFIAMAAWVPTAGEQFTNNQGSGRVVVRDQRVWNVG
jgi:hypothetical protein